MGNEKDIPILMSAPMVVALLENRKTQTRRIIKPQPQNSGLPRGSNTEAWLWHGGPALVRASYGAPYVHTDRHAMERAMLLVSRFQVGTKLWVRETFAEIPNDGGSWVYRATDPDWATTEGWKWKPSIFMPRSASRLTLEITNVVVERLQDISEEDARAEGVRLNSTTHWETEARDAYRSLWNSINGAGSWDLNPYVYAVTFRKP